MTKAVAEAAEAQYWDALADDEFERYERKQRFIDHFAAVLTNRQANVGCRRGEVLELRGTTRSRSTSSRTRRSSVAGRCIERCTSPVRLLIGLEAGDDPVLGKRNAGAARVGVAHR
jgi:hypothetical protein